MRSFSIASIDSLTMTKETSLNEIGDNENDTAKIKNVCSEAKDKICENQNDCNENKNDDSEKSVQDTLRSSVEVSTLKTDQQPVAEMLTLSSFGIVEAESSSGVGVETVEKLVKEADAALEACQTLFGKVEGTTKLRKRIASELKFLRGLYKEPQCDLSQVQSSNMRHLLGILHVAQTYPDVTHLLKNISSRKRPLKEKITQPTCDDDEQFSITSDIICNKGSSWVKVIARNAQALHLIWAGRGHYGANTLFYQAEDFLQLAKENPINYAVPSVTFVFFNGVTSAMADALQEMGVSVVGRREEVNEETQSRLQALTEDDSDDNDDDDEGRGSHRDKRLRSESSSSSSPSDTLGDESIEGEYVLDDPLARLPNLSTEEEGEDEFEQEEDLDLDVKLSSVLGVGASSPTLEENDSSFKNASSSFINTSSSSINASSAMNSSSTKNASSSCASSDKSFPSSSSQTGGTNADLDPYSVPWKVGQKRSENPRVFLDISTMIAMTSALCNGHANYVFEDKILTEQAERERDEPLLPTVEPVLEGKELYTCQMAADDFRKILGIMGGPEEKKRGENLLNSLNIVEDAPSERAKKLKESASVKARAKVIFGTADSLKALICSANSGFVRAAGGQGVNFAVHIHQSRALTEEKQQTATKLG